MLEEISLFFYKQWTICFLGTNDNHFLLIIPVICIVRILFGIICVVTCCLCVSVGINVLLVVCFPNTLELLFVLCGCYVVCHFAWNRVLFNTVVSVVFSLD